MGATTIYLRDYAVEAAAAYVGLKFFLTHLGSTTLVMISDAIKQLGFEQAALCIG